MPREQHCHHIGVTFLYGRQHGRTIYARHPHVRKNDCKFTFFIKNTQSILSGVSRKEIKALAQVQPETL